MNSTSPTPKGRSEPKGRSQSSERSPSAALSTSRTRRSICQSRKALNGIWISSVSTTGMLSIRKPYVMTAQLARSAMIRSGIIVLMAEAEMVSAVPR